MWEGPLSLAGAGIFLALFLGPIGIGVGVLSVKKPRIWIAKSCFTLSAIILLGWLSWIIIILPIQAPFAIRITLIILTFDLISIGWIELVAWIDSNKIIEQPIIQPVIEPTPLIVRSLLINQPYSFGIVLGGIRWSSDYRDLRIIFDNPTNNDYQDIDMTVGPDFPNIIIAAIGQISNIPNVTFHTPAMQAYLKPDGTPDVKFDKKIGHSVGDKFIFRVENQSKGQGLTPLRVYPNRYRIRCEKLPRHMILEITLAIPIQDIAKQKGKISAVWINGQYNGGTQIQTIDQNITVDSQSFIPLLSPS